MRAAAFLFLIACGAPSHETRESSAPPACPEGSHWDGTLCIRPPTVTTAPTHVASQQQTGAWTPPSPHVPPDTNAARAHFTKGIELYSNGDATGALVEFEAAYAHQPADALLYNIAIALEHLGRVDEALDVYGRYLQTSMGRSRSVEVIHRMDALKMRK